MRLAGGPCGVCDCQSSSGFYRSRDERWPGRWCRGCYKRWRRCEDPTNSAQASSGEPLSWLIRMLGTGDPNACWEWPYARDLHGYGKISLSGRTTKLSHVALELAGQPKPDGKVACHSCDNPPCCNPNHLRWDTHAGNGADMRARGRGRNQHSKRRNPNLGGSDA
jgi:hypothetical protein